MIPITCNAVGDIIALASLIRDIARALTDIRGSTFEYRSFTGELNGLHTMLNTAARVAENSADSALRDEIVREVDQCGRDVQRALAQIAKFSMLDNDNSVGDAPRVRLKRNWCKVKWHLMQHEDTQTVRRELAMATQRLTTLLVVSNTAGATQFRRTLLQRFDALVSRDTAISRVIDHNTAVLSELRAKPVTNHSDMVRGLSESVPDGMEGKTAVVAVLCASICSMHSPYDRVVPTALLLVAICILLRSSGLQGRKLVHNVAYTSTNAVAFLDALGRRLILPYELCESHDIFHATLVNLFSHTKGRWFIDAHKYAITTGLKSVGVADWNLFIQPGAEVEMVIIVQLVTEVNLSDVRITCPVCRVDNFGDGLQATCTSCQKALSITVTLPHVPMVDSTNNAAEPKDIKATDDRGRFPRFRSKPTRQNDYGSSRGCDADTLDCWTQKCLPDDHGQRTTTMRWLSQIWDFARIRIQIRGSELLRFSRLTMAIANSAHDLSGLTTAAENGHYGLVAEMLDAGMDVNASDRNGYTALHFACWNGHTQVVDLLLNRGAAIDAPTIDGFPPLACAMISLQHDVSKLLLTRGAILDAPGPVQRVALHTAITVSDISVVKLLLDLGVDIIGLMPGSFFVATALHTAVHYANRHMVGILLQHGADINVRDDSGHTPLTLAAALSQEIIFGHLFSTRSAPLLDGEGHEELLYHAVLGGSSRIVEMVLQTDVDVNKRFWDGTTPLSLSSELGHAETVELLLAHGGDPNGDAVPVGYMSRPGHRWKPLHAAAYLGRTKAFKVLQLLLQHGADVNARMGHGGYTPLSILLERRMDELGSSSPIPLRDDETVNLLLKWDAMLDERSTVLLQEFKVQSEGGSDESNVPGAWSDT